jgi:flagellin-like hook-associated protein FlgL
MALPPVNSIFNLNRSISQARNQLTDLQRQLSTGKISATYAGLGTERTQSLAFRGELSQISGYRNTISFVNIRLAVLQQSLGRVNEIAAETRSDTFALDFLPQANNQTNLQAIAHGRFIEMVDLLNQEAAGRHLFAGRETDKNPVVSGEDILNGSGSKAGFLQIADERRQADVGANGLGRLDIPVPAAATVNITEDAVGSPFGLKLNTATSALTGTTVTGPAGAPQDIALTFTATLPNDGDTIKITFDLPDGTQTDVTLTARAAPLTLPQPGEFEIGADENATAANFQAELLNVVQTAVQTELRAASLHVAADNFFDFDTTTPPQRVDGPPFDSATALKDATTADTVFWYEGELATDPPRQSATAKIDDSNVVGYGARANEQALRTVLKKLAVISADTFPPADTNAKARYQAINTRAGQALAFPAGTQSVENLISEFTVIQARLDDMDTRHNLNENMVLGFVEDIENADIFEVSAEILAVQNRLEASLAVTSSLSRISLINFL